ncbi:LPD7 domain-containing protein [Pseudomonas sp. JG-B]|uniref:LPD7 domain-containing protein n=1 Tax=Pseudomonas sp. JG-B TaxID=2603214 RepID=UPI00129E8A29|nr:LPD7 domain-containing protein [Pseudomonas sp. JG-B]MRK19074.1 hypothetical protein [Pseudomonas sp. JG-B]
MSRRDFFKVPQDLKERYELGPDNKPRAKDGLDRPYIDAGSRLETNSNSPEMAKDFVRIAESRGWSELRVSGSEQFRSEVWKEATSRGLDVKGYQASELDKKEAAERAGNAAPRVIRPEQQDKDTKARSKRRWQRTRGSLQVHVCR